MINKFAQNSEIKMLVEEKQINTSQFKRILSNKGIFSLVRNAEELSNQIYPFFFGSIDIQFMKELMQSSTSYEKSSIIKINPIDEYETLDEFIDMFKEEDEVIIVMKNISAYELSFDTNEITNRFKHINIYSCIT